MKRTLLFLISLIFIYTANGQEFKSYVGINTGISIPVGKFADKTLDGGSFALPGWEVNLEGAWNFYKGLGAGLMAAFYAHPVDAGALGNERLQSDPFLEDLIIRSDPYRTMTLVGFAQYSFHLPKSFTATPRAGGGILFGFSPYQLYKATYYLAGPRWYEVTSTRDYGGYFTAGATIDYKLNDCVGLVLEANYGYGTLRYRFRTSGGNIRVDVHHFMTVDVLLGFRIFI